MPRLCRVPRLCRAPPDEAHLAHGCNADWACEGKMGSRLHSDLESLDLSSRPFLEKSVEHMVDGIEALRQDQERAEYRKRDAERCLSRRLPAACALSANGCLMGEEAEAAERPAGWLWR